MRNRLIRSEANKTINNSILAVSLLALLNSVGVIGYMLIEHYTFVEALYMTVITVSTVGFEEVHNLSTSGMLFTVFLITFSLGIFGFVLTSITRYIFEGVYRNYYKDNKVRRKINKLENHVIVCGYGRVGKQATEDLLAHDVKVVVIDNSEEEISILRQKENVLFIQGDATVDEIIESARIETAQALITTFPKDADNLFVVLSARVLNNKMKIISRASDEHSDVKLKRAGASNIIMPDRIGGQRMAKLVAQPDIVEFLENIIIQGTNDVNLEEFSCKDLNMKFHNKTIGELGVRNKSGANIIGLKNEKNAYTYNPSANTKLQSSDMLFVLGTTEQLISFKRLLITGE